MLELPDDLDPRVLGGIVAGSNEEIGESDFALFASGQRADANWVKPVVSFRELAAYRQGTHLAVTYASDNRGMHTYTSVYPKLFSPGFPDEAEEMQQNGVASLSELASQAAQVLSKKHGLDGERTRRLEEELPVVARFLADAYKEAGNGQTSLAADWWFHVDEWLLSLDEWIAARGADNLDKVCQGSACLPITGDAARISPREFVKILTERWNSAESIRADLARLSADAGTQASAESFEELPWEAEMPNVALRTDSAISRAALLGRLDSRSREARTHAWANLVGNDLKEAFVDARDGLLVRAYGVDVPRPWSKGPYVLVVPADAEEQDGWLDLGQIDLVLPWKTEGVPMQDELPSKIEGAVNLSGARRTEASFVAASCQPVPSGLKVTGGLKVKPSKKSPHLASLTVTVDAMGSALVVDKSSVELNIVRHDEVMLIIRQASSKGSGRKGLTGPIVWREGEEVKPIPLMSAANYVVAIAAGTGTSAGSGVVSIKEQGIDGSWPCDVVVGKYVLADAHLDDGAEIAASAPVFAIEIQEQEASKHIAPVIAAAFSQQPDLKRNPGQTGLFWLDSLVTDQLRKLASGAGIGAALFASGSEEREKKEAGGNCLVEATLWSRLGQLTPGMPTPRLASLSQYADLVDAYKALEIIERIDELQEGNDVTRLTISRISLEFIPQERIDALLHAFVALEQASTNLGDGDRFWAKHPFSVAIFPDELGVQAANAVLTSPLHPIRLAWLWLIEKGLRAAHDDGLSPVAALELIDPAVFPAHLAVSDPLGMQSHYIPMPVDASPDSLFLGWQALVQFASGEAKMPRHVSGHPFPVEGLSSISPGAVSSALDDFRRVSPHVQNIRIGLEATVATNRSQALDEGVLDKISGLARKSGRLNGIGGVSIFDSTNRMGPIPSLQGIDEALKIAGPRFNVSWTSCLPGTTNRLHLSFLEGTAARLALIEGVGGNGWIPAIPLRRFPARTRQVAARTDLDYSLPAPKLDTPAFERALHSYEVGPAGKGLSLGVLPNLAALPSRPSWLVAGDFGADPQAIADAASSTGGSRYMLWDWRPISTVESRSQPGTSRVQPYFILASVPDALSSSISDRIGKLKPGLSQEAKKERTERMVSVLSKRAIGLNTLLAIGHHQATGALGFFFAIESITRWMSAAPEGEVRAIIPVDAVDPYLRRLPGAAHETRRRADLIAISMRASDAGTSKIVLVPIEVKHYGLQSGPAGFPGPEDAGFKEHLSQLKDYQVQLSGLVDAYEQSASSSASIFGSRLAIVVEAGLQLCAHSVGAAQAKMLHDIAEGAAQVDVGKGLLLWYQAGGTTPGGDNLEVTEIDGADGEGHLEVRIDPSAYDECYWGELEGEPHIAVCDALERAMATSIMTREVDARREAVPSDTGQDESALTEGHEAPAQEEGEGESLSPQVQAQSSQSTDVPMATPSERKLLPRRELEQRYARILGSLEEFGVKAKRPNSEEPPFTEGPAFVEYAIEPSYGVSVSKIESQLDNLKLRLKLSSDAQIGCATHLGNVLLSVPKNDSDRYYVDAEQVWAKWKRPPSGCRIPLGEDMRGAIVDVDLASSNSPHLLIGGVTGSGKSEALLTLLHGATRYYGVEELRLMLVDPKRTELVSLEPVPHRLGEIGASAEDAINLLASAVDEMERRYELFRQGKVRDVEEYQSKVGPLPRWIIVLDEYADLTSDDDERKEIEKSLKRLAQKARAAGVHLVVSTQKPVVSVINTVVKGNLPGRIALRVGTASESKVILDEVGAEKLVGKGDALMKVGAKRIRLQFAKITGA